MKYFAWRNCQDLFICLCLYLRGLLIVFVSGISASKGHCWSLFASVHLNLHWITLASSHFAWRKLGQEKKILISRCRQKNVSKIFESVKLKFSEQLNGCVASTGTTCRLLRAILKSTVGREKTRKMRTECFDYRIRDKPQGRKNGSNMITERVATPCYCLDFTSKHLVLMMPVSYLCVGRNGQPMLAV